MAAFVWRRSGIIEYLDVARAVADRFGFHIPDDAVLAIVPFGECASSMSRSPAGVQQRKSMAELLSRAHHPSLLHLKFPAYRTAPEDLSVNASNFSMAHVLPV